MEADIKAYKNDSTKKVPYIINTFLTRNERESIHKLCEELGLYHNSFGTGKKKHMIVSKERISKEITDQDRHEFIKGTGLPISINREPYFSYQVDELDKLYNTKYYYDLFTSAINIINDEDNQDTTFMKYSYKLSSDMVDAIKKTASYAELANTKYKIKDLPNDIKLAKILYFC